MTGSDLPTPGEMVEAFVHPPRLVEVARREASGDGRVLVVSHVELWPWRVVVRGVIANHHPTTVDPVDGEAMRARFLLDSEWMTGWSLVDDADSEYHSSTGSMGGSGGDTWVEFHIEWHPCVPAAATTLTIRPPDGNAFDVPLAPNA